MTTRPTNDPVADELAILNLLAELAWHADNTTIDDIDDYVACFTPDAEWEMLGDVRRGHDQIREGGIERRKINMMGPGSKVAHFLAMTVVSFDDPDTAPTKSYIQAYRNADTDAPTLFLMGQYHDVFRRTDDGWKLHRRRVDFTWT